MNFGVSCLRENNRLQLLKLSDSNRVGQMHFIEFFALHSSPSIEEISQFKERLDILCQDLTHLLSLSLSQFWNELLFNPSFRCSISSILSRVPRYELDCVPNDIVSSLNHLLSLALAIFTKASVPESNESYCMTTQTFGELIYENYVFDVAVMIDLCSIYYDFARPQLISILTNVFLYQTKYWEDVKSMMQELPKIFSRVEDEVTTCPHTLDWFTDMLAYIADISWSLYTFFSTIAQLPTTTEVIDLNIAELLPEKLAAFFENVFVPLQGEIESDLQLTAQQRDTCLSTLSQASTHLVNAVRQGMIEPYLLERIRQQPIEKGLSSDKTAVTLTQSFIQLMLQLLNYRRFSLALHILYPLETDLSFLRQRVGQQHIDDATVQYLLGATDCLLSENNLTRESLERSIIADLLDKKVPTPTPVEEPKPGPSITGSVREVKEVLPHMDIALIQRCLAEFNDDAGRVINAALEGSIPDHVLYPDRITPKKQKTAQLSGSNQLDLDLATAAACGAVELNANHLWQGKRDPSVNDTRISLPALGKREKRVTIRSAISVWDDDGEEDPQNPETGVGASESVDELTKEVNKLFVDEYEDEYDDTYDVHEGAVDDLESGEESAGEQRLKNVVDSVDASNPRAPQQGRQPVLRIENPEMVRERQQQYQQSRRGFRRGRGASFQGSHTVPPQPMPPGDNFAYPPAGFDGRYKPMNSGGFSTHHHRSTNAPSNSGSVEQTGNNLLEPPKQEASADRHNRTSHKTRFTSHNRRRLADRKRQF